MVQRIRRAKALGVYEQYIAISKYARWLPELSRRETWDETVQRFIDFYSGQEKFRDANVPWDELHQAIADHEVMPSMRALMAAGPALAKENVTQYNCCYMDIDDPQRYKEMLYILMCGTGVGFGVEMEHMLKLKAVPADLHVDDSLVIRVADSREGWALACGELLESIFDRGLLPAEIDVSAVRGKGAPLKTMGGRASGPEPLLELFQNIIRICTGAKGRKLTDEEAHDLACYLAAIVVVGGVRRSALIGFSDLFSAKMRVAKSGPNWYQDHKQRSNANNSAVYHGRPESREEFDAEFKAIMDSFSGERGIYNTHAVEKHLKMVGEREKRTRPNGKTKLGFEGSLRRLASGETLRKLRTNPCSEILLQSMQFCNLTEVVVRWNDTLQDLKRKVRLATILGTVQASMTDFNEEILSKEWRERTEEEALLGVSLTGCMDHPVLNMRAIVAEPDEMKRDYLAVLWLDDLRMTARETNEEWAGPLGVNISTGITCIKPSGTVSQLVNSASGIHGRHAQKYIRTVRGNNQDPLVHLMKDLGIPNEPCQQKPAETTIFSFPQQAPDTSIFRKDYSAVQQLEVWRLYQKHYCEHKPSITVTYRECEKEELCQWIWDHFDEMTGVALLPTDDHIYPQAPYQDATDEVYEEAVGRIPAKIEWEMLSFYETEDCTASTKSFACTAGGNCEDVDL